MFTTFYHKLPVDNSTALLLHTMHATERMPVLLKLGPFIERIYPKNLHLFYTTPTTFAFPSMLRKNRLKRRVGHTRQL